MRARKVKGLDPAGPLAGNAERIVRTRLDELCSFMPVAADPSAVTELHDMRIAAKRLRYVLEVTGACFGDYAGTAVRHVKELQDLLGEIHDCDVLAPRGLGLIESSYGPPRVGLAALLRHVFERREDLFARFLAFWAELERDGFRARLEYAIGERPAGTTVGASS